MWRNLAILLILALILALPFAFRQEAGVREWSEGDPVLVVMAEPAASLASEIRRLLPDTFLFICILQHDRQHERHRRFRQFRKHAESPCVFGQCSQCPVQCMVICRTAAADPVHIDAGEIPPALFRHGCGKHAVIQRLLRL